MKKLLTISVLAAACLATSSQADITQGPDHSFMWNSFNSIDVLDSFAIVTSDNGLALLKFNGDSQQFDPVNQILLDTRPGDVRIAGQIAIVMTWSDDLYFVDLSNLPALSLAGKVSLGTTVYDLALVDSDLYVACGFDGLRHYTLVDYSTLEFVDSSLDGVHCVQVEAFDRKLLVLDDYNGVLRYDLDSLGIHVVEDILYLPKRVHSFLMSDSYLLMPVIDEDYYYRRHVDDFRIGYLETRDLRVKAERLFRTDMYLIAVESYNRRMQVFRTYISGSPSSLVGLSPDLDIRPAGDLYNLGDGDHLLLVSGTLGLLDCDLDNPHYPSQGFSRPGPITALDFHQGRLATGGRGSPLELYTIGFDSEPEFDTAVSDMSDVSSVADAGDLLFAHFPSAGQISAFRFTDGSIQTVASISTYNQVINRLRFYEYQLVDSLSLLLTMGRRFVELLTIAESGQITRADNALTQEDVVDAIVIDSFLMVMTDGPLYTFQIHNDFQIELMGGAGGSAEHFVKHIVSTGPRESNAGGSPFPSMILVFAGNNMGRVVFRDLGPFVLPLIYPISTLPVDVTNSVLRSNNLLTVGEQGVGRIDLGFETPQMVEFGSHGGNLIACGDSTLATTDGTAIHLYSLSPGTTTSVDSDESTFQQLSKLNLQPNYPNPFNPRTRIEFSVPEPTRVTISVFDLLGRKLTCLVDRYLEAGLHSVEWDGTDRFGHPVASGVYFYQLTTDAISESRKMVLLK